MMSPPIPMLPTAPAAAALVPGPVAADDSATRLPGVINRNGFTATDVLDRDTYGRARTRWHSFDCRVPNSSCKPPKHNPVAGRAPHTPRALNRSRILDVPSPSACRDVYRARDPPQRAEENFHNSALASTDIVRLFTQRRATSGCVAGGGVPRAGGCLGHSRLRGDAKRPLMSLP
jgi:hypothetical protein